MKVTRKPVFIFLAFAILLLAPGVSLADITQDCMKSCSDQKTSDDMNCQGPAQSADQGRVDCLKNNQDIYNGCIQNCSPSSSPAASAPQNTNPQGGTTPQASTTQNTTPQGTTSQGSTFQRMAPRQGSPQP